jgi:hypothetical protein
MSHIWSFLEKLRQAQLTYSHAILVMYPITSPMHASFIVFIVMKYEMEFSVFCHTKIFSVHLAVTCPE